ncbi:MAG: hypothetical protein Q7U66_06200 [Methylobacter sp.]|nr:hypothetical protein [Methylobacter sp.]
MSDSAKNQQSLDAHETPGIPKASTAIATLFEKAADHLTAAELNWFSSSMRDQAALELDNVSQAIEAAGCMVASSDLSTCMQDEETLSRFLFSVSSQLDTITGFMKIGSEASYRLKLKAEAKSQA